MFLGRNDIYGIKHEIKSKKKLFCSWDYLNQCNTAAPNTPSHVQADRLSLVSSLPASPCAGTPGWAGADLDAEHCSVINVGRALLLSALIQAVPWTVISHCFQPNSWSDTKIPSTPSQTALPRAGAVGAGISMAQEPLGATCHCSKESCPSPLGKEGQNSPCPRGDKTDQQVKGFWQNVLEVVPSTGSSGGAAWLPEEQGWEGILTPAKHHLSSPHFDLCN